MKKIQKVLFMGSKKLGLAVLREMHRLAPAALAGALTVDDSADSRSVLADMKAFTSANGINLHIACNRKQAEESVLSVRPDICIVAGWYWLISKQTLKSVPDGFIGIHNSLLPEYRGGSPLIWAVINGERKVGVSLFTFTEGMDDGPVWAQGAVSVGAADYIADILIKLENKAAEVIRLNYLRILNRAVKPVAQDKSCVTYCAQRFPADGNVDWSKPAKCVFNFIRAQSEPYPGAFTWLGHEKMNIWRAAVFNKKYYGTPGQVARIDADGVYVICGNNRAIILKEIELAGKRGFVGDIVKSIKIRFSAVPAKSKTI